MKTLEEKANATIELLKRVQSYKDCELSIEGFYQTITGVKFDVVALDNNGNSIFGASLKVRYGKEDNAIYFSRSSVGEYKIDTIGQKAINYFTVDLLNNEKELKEFCRKMMED